MSQAKKGSQAFRIGSWAMVGVGIGHTLGQIATAVKAPTPQQTLVYEAMKSFQPMGTDKHSLYDFYMGDTYGIGLMYLAFGVLCLLAERAMSKKAVPLPRSIPAFCAVVTFASLTNAILFFPIPPIAFFVVALGAFGWAAAKAK